MSQKRDKFFEDILPYKLESVNWKNIARRKYIPEWFLEKYFAHIWKAGYWKNPCPNIKIAKIKLNNDLSLWGHMRPKTINMQRFTIISDEFLLAFFNDIFNYCCSTDSSTQVYYMKDAINRQLLRPCCTAEWLIDNYNQSYDYRYAGMNRHKFKDSYQFSLLINSLATHWGRNLKVSNFSSSLYPERGVTFNDLLLIGEHIEWDSLPYVMQESLTPGQIIELQLKGII